VIAAVSARESATYMAPIKQACDQLHVAVTTAYNGEDVIDRLVTEGIAAAIACERISSVRASAG